MRLINFSVTNFRSITSAHRVSISNRTVLIGKNNEGKSNILKALNIAMNALLEHSLDEKRGYGLRRRYSRSDENIYCWERDFPINLQDRKSGNQSIFRLEFELNEKEIKEFKEVIKSTLNGTLPLEIKIGPDNRPSIKVLKKGKGGKALTAKSGKISRLVANKIWFNYIPAVRTDQEAFTVIRNMLSHELRILETDESYVRALKVIKELQQPILDRLASKIKEPLAEFLPNIRQVRIEILENERRMALRQEFEVIIDDGTPTNIELKGDGVKSLAALGLLKERYSSDNASIIAIEEPESHHHPAAIHQLNEVVSSLSKSSQVIITTHNPLFVDRHSIKSNIIINSGKASVARNIKEIRELLGIKASDNLVNANYALVVEGEEDAKALKALLPALSDKLGKAIKNNLFVLEPIGGAGNLSYKLSLLSNALCVYHVLLDNDESGREAFGKAFNDGHLTVNKCTMINCSGMNNSEFEDCIDVEVYKERINELGVDLNNSRFRGNKKWSVRMKSVFMAQGKPWNDTIEEKVKYVVAESIANHPNAALNPHKRNSIDALVTALENMIEG